jgi:hypothetical protein
MGRNAMIGTLISAASLLVAAQGGEQIECSVSAEMRADARSYPTAIALTCPSGVEDPQGLQAAADAAVARLAHAPAGGRDFTQIAYMVAETVAFHRTEAGWIPLAGQELVFGPPVFPRRAMESGADLAACVTGYMPDGAGVPREAQVSCVINDGRADSQRLMNEAMARSVAYTRMVPVDTRYCHIAEVAVQGIARGSGSSHEGPALDLSRLPRFCGEVSG